jgi:hypothetical protein
MGDVTMAEPAADGPGFGNAPSYISDVQVTHAISPDKKAISILFDNFTVTLVPLGPPVAIRTFSLVLPLKGVEVGATLTGGLQGGGGMEPGTGATLIFRALGVSQMFDPLFGPGDENSFTKAVDLKVPAGGDLRMTIIVVLEGNPADPNGQATVTLDAVDFTIGPPKDDRIDV